MNKRNSQNLKSIKRKVFIVVSSLFLILFTFLYHNLLSEHRKYENQTIIRVFDEQKLYTQMISKDASRIFELLLAEETGYSSEDESKRKIKELKEDLSQARDAFDENLCAIHRKEIVTDSNTFHLKDSRVNTSKYLKNVDDLWREFDEAVVVVLTKKQIDDEMTDAVIYINNNNLELLGYCDELQDQILNDFLRDDQKYQSIAYGMVSFLTLVIIISLIKLQSYLTKPFSQLYQGIAEIGLDSDPVKSNLAKKKKIAPSEINIDNILQKFNNLISLMENINSNDSFMETLNFISRTFSQYIPYNYIGIALISEDKKYLRGSYAVSDESIIGLPEKIRGVSWLISDTNMGELIESGDSIIINDLEEYYVGKPQRLYNKAFMEAGIRASIILPLRLLSEPVGIIFFCSAHKNVYTKEHLNFLRTLATSLAISLNQNIFVNDIIYSSILALAKLAEARDEDTGEHLDRIAIYARVIAELLHENNIYTDEITLDFIDKIEQFSPLHDIGKVAIRDNILLKPGKLSKEEFDEIKQHAFFGAEVLKSAEQNLQRRGKRLFGMGVEIAEGHHEKWDGSGYPYGKKGLDIPVSARIVALADVFDALTSKRPYKEAFSLDKAFEIITEGRGKHFDPVIVDAFLANRSRIEGAYQKFRMKEEAVG